MLLHHLHIGDDHPPIHRLAHIVDGEQPDLHRGQRFHLDTRAPDRFHAHFAMHAGQGFIDREIHRDARQRQRMTQRNQIGGAFCALNRGDAGDAEHVALLGAALANQRERAFEHRDRAARHGNAPRFAFRADIDHVRLAGGIEMSESRHSISFEWAPIIPA